MGIIKKVKEVVSTKKDKSGVATTKKDNKAPKANVGDPFLGMGVEFYPSDETRTAIATISDKKVFDGEIVLIIGDGIVKVKVEELAPRIFKCKSFNDPTLNTLIDNSWKEKR